MNHKWIISSLRSLHRSFRNILEDDAGNVIEEAVASVTTSKQRYDERRRRSDDPRLVVTPWGYQIDPDRPLRFKVSEAIKGFEPRVDIFSTVLWMNEGESPVKQSTHLRVWSNSDYAFRAALDAQALFDRMADPSHIHNGRVMWRCHFDLADPGQAGPKHHLQYGGNAREYELCWFPEVIDIPRLACPPMDLILVCQIVAANFFEEKYSEFRESPEWMMAVRYSQEHLIRNYYRECVAYLDDKRSLLDNLWNV